MSLVKSEFLTVNIAPETTLGTQATAAWWQAEPDAGGIADFYANLKEVAREPVSKDMMEKVGEVVGLDAAPKLTGDLNVDLLNMLGASILRTTVKYPGGTGTGRWTSAAGYGARVTAVVGSPGSFTVDGGGALPQGVIVLAEGFANAANNGIHVLTTGSTGTSIKTVDTLVNEAAPPANARLWVVGFQAQSGDFGILVTGGVVTLTSTANALGTLGITADSWIWVGGGTAAAPGALGFVTAANRGLAHVSAVAAGALTIDRTATTFVTEAAPVGKTIQIFFGPWLRNVPNDSADYAELSHSLELVLPKLAAGPADAYVYATGDAIGTFDIDAGLEALVKCTIGFVGMNCTDPTTTRATGAAAALAPLGVAAFQTADGIKRGRVTKQDGTVVLGSDIQSWKLSINNNIKPYKAQGGDGNGNPGNRGLLFGKIQATVTLNAAIAQPDLWQAARANTKLRWEEMVRNGDGAGLLLDFPYCTAMMPSPNFAANDVGTFAPVLRAFKDPASGKALALQLFPYLPQS